MAHVHIIGASGSGKSNYAKRLMNAAICAGEGLLFLDPHGEDATDLLDTIPQERLQTTFLLDPSEFPINWNPLDAARSQHDLIATAHIDIIRSLAKLSDSATANMDMTVHSCVSALLETGGTLLDIPRLLTNKQFRKEITDSLTDSAGKEHWAWFEKLDERQRGDITRSTYNKFYQLASDKKLRKVLGHNKTKLNVFDVVHKGHILIVRLPVGKLGSAKTRLLGNMVLGMVLVAGMSRPTHTRFNIVLDELHWWAPDIVQEAITGARKFNIRVIGINQFVSQLDPSLFDALKGNAEQHVFRVAADDARQFQRWFPENALTVNLEDLPDFTYRKFPWLKGDKDVTLPPFDAERFPASRPYIENNMRFNYTGGKHEGRHQEPSRADGDDPQD